MAPAANRHRMRFMNKPGRCVIVTPVLCASLLATAGCSRESAAPPAAKPAAPLGSGLDLSALNRSVDACTDFYQFACGGWLARNTIPADRPRWGRFDELQERN